MRVGTVSYTHLDVYKRQLFHLSVTQTKRSAGQSAIASAAYRAGERLYSEYYGEYSDYTRKGGVICSDTVSYTHLYQKKINQLRMYQVPIPFLSFPLTPFP